MRAQIDSVLGMNLVERNRQQQVVDVVAAKVRVAIGGLHLEDSVDGASDGNVEGAATEVVNGNGADVGAIKPVGERRRGWLIDEAKDFKPSHASRILGGLALRIVEVCRNGDDGLRYRRAEEALGVALELAQNVGGDFRRSEAQFAELDARYFPSLDVIGQPERKELQFAPALLRAPAP